MDKLEPRAMSDRKINDHIAKCHRLPALSRTIRLDFLLVRDDQSSGTPEYAASKVPGSDEQMEPPHLQLLEHGWDTPSANVTNLVQECEFSSL
jgi:hypothetical protein